MEKLTKRILAAIMTAMLLITMLPVSAIEQELGDETEGTAAAEQVTETQGDTVEEPEETEEAEDTEENTVDAEIPSIFSERGGEEDANDDTTAETQAEASLEADVTEDTGATEEDDAAEDDDADSITADETEDVAALADSDVLTVESVEVAVVNSLDLSGDNDAENETEDNTVFDVSTVSEMTTALANAVDGDTIRLVNDLSIGSTTFKITTGITLDLNGYTITAGNANYTKVIFALYTSDEVTIKNGAIDGNTSSKCVFVANYSSTTAYSSNNTLVLKDLTVQNFSKGAATNSSYFKSSLIRLESATALIMDNCTICDNGYSALWFTGSDNSEVQISACTIKDNMGYYGACGGFYISGATKVTIKNCTIDSNISKKASLSGGGIHLASCGDVTIESNEITNNANYSGTNASGAGGGIYISSGEGATYIVNNTISNNKAYNYGGGIYINNRTGAVTISKNTITENATTAKAGGGVYISSINGDLTVQENTVSANVAVGYGGGLYIANTSAYEFGTVSVTDNVISNNSLTLGSKESEDTNASTYNSHGGGICFFDNATKHTITTAYDFSGNTITNNAVDSDSGRGGGLTVYANDENREILIASGLISNNTASWGGGIDYTYHGASTLRLYNAIITDNSAARGGGVWSCPSSTTTIYSTLGGTVYGNTATATGDSLRFEGTDTDSGVSGSGGVYVSVAARALGGTLIDWYADDVNARYSAGDATVDLSEYTNRTTSFGLYGELSEQGIALAEAQATLVICDNTATYVGGGIASNSAIVFGNAGTTTIQVTKEWVNSNGETLPSDSALIADAVTLQLVAISSGEEILLEQVQLTAENDWSWSFTELPTNYTYKVVEVAVDDTVVDYTDVVINEDGTQELGLYTVSYSELTQEEDGTYSMTITNQIETVDCSVSKTWDDSDDQDGIRPDSITIRLYADGEEIATASVTAEDDWSHTFSNLRKYDSEGVVISYTITEDEVDGYTTTIDGFDVTNTHVVVIEEETPDDEEEKIVKDETKPDNEEDTTPDAEDELADDADDVDDTNDVNDTDNTDNADVDTEETANSASVKTGDNAPIAMLFAVMIASVVAYIALMMYERRKYCD